MNLMDGYDRRVRVMYCIGTVDSGNFALNLCRILETKGYVVEVIPTPCRIAKDGCGYCLRFPEEYMNVVLDEAKSSNIRIREIYRVIPAGTRNRYDRIY